MSKEIIGLRNNGYVTPEKQAEFLSKYGHLEFIVDGVKYYSYKDNGFKVINIGGKVVQIVKISKKEIGLIESCSKVKFGGF